MTAYVDDEDYPLVSRHGWTAHGGKNGVWYAKTNLNAGGGKRKFVLMHRFILNPERQQLVDHRDRNGLNNCRANLRLADNSKNLHNCKKRRGTISQFKGVSFFARAGRWTAKIQVNGVAEFLGYFSDELEAARAYDEAARRHLGEFALTNF